MDKARATHFVIVMGLMALQVWGCSQQTPQDVLFRHLSRLVDIATDDHESLEEMVSQFRGYRDSVAAEIEMARTMLEESGKKEDPSSRDSWLQRNFDLTKRTLGIPSALHPHLPFDVRMALFAPVLGFSVGTVKYSGISLGESLQAKQILNDLDVPEISGKVLPSLGPLLVVNQNEIRLNGRRLVKIHAGRIDGVASEKFMIKPLFEALKRQRDGMRQLAQHLPGFKAEKVPLLIAMAYQTPSPLLGKIMYSAGQAGFGRFGILGKDKNGRYRSVNLKSPTIGGLVSVASTKKRKKKLNLTVTVTNKGLYIAGLGGVIGQPGGRAAERGSPSVPVLLSGDTCREARARRISTSEKCHDLSRLRRLLTQIKDQFPEESRIIFLAEPDVSVAALVGIMDASREHDGRILFPDAVLTQSVGGGKGKMLGGGFGGGGLGGGLEGLGRKRSDSDGGNTIGVGGLGKRGGERNVRISVGRPIVMGSLSMESIRRVMHSHRDQIEFCYSKELIRNPNLAGKVTIKFTISPKGFVQSATVSATTLKNATVERCMSGKIRNWKFPEPKGGGIVIVTYPFILRSN
ncbi:MAG: AgmX/PglI C-terminal domain-containing protein [Deltaproteobacteria bacterium]|nr:AgmX/PglI C-terminal domain-containing protein [Deltaproteobacteria bacterium]